MLKENEFANHYDNDEQHSKPTNVKPIREGQPMGGQKFGQNNNTPSGNDRNNPSRNSGNTNAYFRRTEPSEEHPEDSNFKPPYQDGEPDYNSAQPYAKVGNDINSENKTSANSTYREGTADDESADNKTSDPDNMDYKADWGDDII